MNVLNISFGEVSFFGESSGKKIIVTVSDDQADGFFMFDSIAEVLKEVPDIAELCLKIADLPQFEHLKFNLRSGGDVDLSGGTIKVKGYSEMKSSKGASILPLHRK